MLYYIFYIIPVFVFFLHVASNIFNELFPSFIELNMLKFKKKNPYSTFTRHLFQFNNPIDFEKVKDIIQEKLNEEKHILNYNIELNNYKKADIAKIIQRTNNNEISFNDIDPHNPIQFYINKDTLIYFSDHTLIDGFMMYQLFAEVFQVKKFMLSKPKPIYIPFFIELFQYITIIYIYIQYKILYIGKSIRHFENKDLQYLIKSKISIDKIKKIKAKTKTSFLSCCLGICSRNVIESLTVRKEMFTICLPYTFTYKKRGNNLSMVIIRINANASLEETIFEIDNKLKNNKFMLIPIYFLINNRFFASNNSHLPIDLFYSSSFIPEETVINYEFIHYAISTPINITALSTRDHVNISTTVNSYDLHKDSYIKKTVNHSFQSNSY